MNGTTEQCEDEVHIMQGLLSRLKAVEAELDTRDANARLQAFRAAESKTERLEDEKIAGAMIYHFSTLSTQQPCSR